MEYRALGPSDLKPSVLVLGTWVLGGGAFWGGDPDERECVRTVRAAIDAGINMIDTAPAYGWGRSERIVGQAVRGRRDQVALATKFGLWTDDERGSFHAEFDGRRVFRCLRPETIRIEIERSLRNLQTDVIDLYQVHWPAMPPDETPIADTMECLMQLRQEGKIRHIGVCNVSLQQLEEYRACGPVISDQFRYSLLTRDAEKDILPYCREHGLGTLTYMSLEQGLLTGKIGMDRVFKPGEFRSWTHRNPWFAPRNRKRVLDMLAGWKDLTDKYGCTLAQLVIAWTAVQPGVTHVLCGARNETQLRENLKGAELRLEAEDVARMRRDAEALGQPEPPESS